MGVLTAPHTVRHTSLVSCETLHENLIDPDWVIFDCRFRLGDPAWGADSFTEGHIPGAFFASVNDDLSAPVGDGKLGRHPLPDHEEFLRFLGRHGVTGSKQIVVYDQEGGWWASRLWWLLRDLGLRNVAVLDGGLTRWELLGYALEEGTNRAAKPSQLGLKAGQMPVVWPTDDGFQDVVLIDARAPERYSGENEPVDVKAGHIPGARNVPFVKLVGGDGRFKSPDELRAYLEDGGLHEPPIGEHGAVVACYCGSGTTATHLVLAAEIAELPTPALYPGSWSAWIDPDMKRPLATGSTP